MIRQDYELRLTFQAPVMSQAAGARRLGVDAAMLTYHGHPVLNGSLVRGNLRHALSYFAQAMEGELADDVPAWFGSESSDAMAPERARLGFDFFWHWVPGLAHRYSAAQPLRYRIRVGEEGTAESRMLQTIESLFAAGERVAFKGRVHGTFEGEEERSDFERWIAKALDHISAMGAFKGVGFGRLCGAELARITPILRINKTRARPRDDRRLGIVLHFDRPFLLGGLHQPQSNRHINGDLIPGAVLKGAIASRYGNDHDLLQDLFRFDDLVFTAAVPAPRGQPRRLPPLPLSLAVFNGPDSARPVIDLAQQDKACVLRSRKEWMAPTFLPDWKPADRQAAERACGRDGRLPERFLTVRTEIQPESNVAAEEKLFSLECTDPAGFVWCAEVELGAVEDIHERRRIIDNLLDLVEEDLENIGKTRARAWVEVQEIPFRNEANPSCSWQIRPPYRVLLCTPARILPPELEVPGTNGDEALAKYYSDYWTYASEGRLSLSHYFAQQERIGGSFYWNYYRKGVQPYQPEWLTVAGSVFVLQPTQPNKAAEIAKLLAAWARLGLPPAEDRVTATWETDPFIRENGFGEVLIDYPLVTELGPDEALITLD